MFSRKKKEKKVNNEDTVVWCPPNESEVVDQGKMINSLAVFAKADEPIYEIQEKPKNKKEYKVNIETEFYMVCSEHLEWVGNNRNDWFCYPKINLNCELFKQQINPIASKIVIDLDKKYYNHKSELLFKNDEYIIYGIPLENCNIYNEDNGERFVMTILCFSGDEQNRYVSIALNFDIYYQDIKCPQYTFYKNPYFLRSLFNFISAKIGKDLAVDIFESIGLFDNTIEL